MAESPEEKEALAKLDEVTREAAWGEEQKEEDREVSTGGWVFGGWRGPGWLWGRSRPFRRVQGDPVPEPLDDPDPAGGPSMHNVMDGAHVDDKVRGTHAGDDKTTP